MFTLPETLPGFPPSPEPALDASFPPSPPSLSPPPPPPVSGSVSSTLSAVAVPAASAAPSFACRDGDYFNTTGLRNGGPQGPLEAHLHPYGGGLLPPPQLSLEKFETPDWFDAPALLSLQSTKGGEGFLPGPGTLPLTVPELDCPDFPSESHSSTARLGQGAGLESGPGPGQAPLPLAPLPPLSLGDFQAQAIGQEERSHDRYKGCEDHCGDGRPVAAPPGFDLLEKNTFLDIRPPPLSLRRISTDPVHAAHDLLRCDNGCPCPCSSSSGSGCGGKVGVVGAAGCGSSTSGLGGSNSGLGGGAAGSMNGGLGVTGLGGGPPLLAMLPLEKIETDDGFNEPTSLLSFTSGCASGPSGFDQHQQQHHHHQGLLLQLGDPSSCTSVSIGGTRATGPTPTPPALRPPPPPPPPTLPLLSFSFQGSSTRPADDQDESNASPSVSAISALGAIPSGPAPSFPAEVLTAPPARPPIIGEGSEPSPSESDDVDFSSMKAKRIPMLEQTTTRNGTSINWAADARKFGTQDKQLVSPPFDLSLPGFEAQQFALVIHPVAVHQSRRGSGFRKSKGRGSIEVKCLSTRLPPNYPRVTFMVAVGNNGPRREPARGPVTHDFAEQSCAGLPKKREEWDLKAGVDEASRTLLVNVEMWCSSLPSPSKI
mmetsp:Transcript_44601/g.95859  ORF Transcript_44601/g.95859 Transcript_44601/m.95859 type:complete len:653 (-) Transcript_44601:334-2292(-)